MARFVARLSLTRRLAVSLVSLVVVSTASAQITNVTGDQAPPVEGAGHDYIKMLNETVNPGNGSVSIRINVPVPPSRGITVPFSFGYDSNAALHFAITGWKDNTGFIGQGGWSYVLPLLSVSPYANTSQNGQSICKYFTDYLFTDLQLANHALYVSTIEPIDSQCLGYTFEGITLQNYLLGGDAQVQAVSGTQAGWAMPPLSIADMGGTVYSFPSTSQGFVTNLGNSWGVFPSAIEDRNGNKTTISATQTPTTITVTDTLGRNALSVSGFGATGNTVKIPGATYTLTWATLAESSSFPLIGQVTSQSYCNIQSGGGGDATTKITGIALPNLKSYQFQYDPVTGLLSKLIYPSGGYIRYIWQMTSTVFDFVGWYGTYSSGGLNQSGNCQATYENFVLKNRFVSFDGVHEVEEQDFAYATTWTGQVNSDSAQWTQRQNTVTTKDLVRGTSLNTVYTYVPFPVPQQPNDLNVPGGHSTPVESMVQYYDTNGSLLRTVQKSYVDPHLPPDETDTLDNSLVSYTHNAYTALWPSSETSPGCGSVYPYVYLCLAVLTDKYEYDYGSGAHGALLQQMHVDYTSFGNTPIFPSGKSILDRPSDVIAYDGSSNKVAETDYAYDQSSVGFVSASGHDNTNYPSGSGIARGNATTKTVKCLQTGCANAVTTYAYDETGQVTSKIDPCGNGTCSDMTGTAHTTTYSYADSYTILSSGANVSYTPAVSTNAFMTKITDPLLHAASFTYDFNNGQLTISKDDDNSQSTKYLYNDSFARPTLVNYPDGGQTQYSYNDSSYNPSTPSPAVTATKSITSSVNEVSTTAFDGLGHTVQTILATDPDGATYNATSYDGLARSYTISNPYRTTSDSTYGMTSNTYDAIGRITSVQRPDGSLVNISYSGNCTTVTDETGNARQSCSDALGRLTQVKEPQGPGTPGAGWASVGGTEQSVQSGGTSGTGSVTISGSERSGQFCPPMGGPCFVIYDCGTVSVTVNSHTTTVDYGYESDGVTLACNQDSQSSSPPSTDTASTVAARLGAAINADTGAFVTASVNGSTVSLTSKILGISGNYAFSAASATFGISGTFSGTSFPITTSGSSLTGGATGQTVYDSGSVWVSVNGSQYSATYGQGSSPSSVANALQTAMSTAPVSVSVSGGTLTLTATQPGSASNYSLSGGSSTSQPGTFSGPSFIVSLSGTALTGGTDSSLTNPLVTQYTYDGLNNLTCAVQKGTDTTAFTNCVSASATWRPRSFAYDSLSRLTSALNPESGTISYTYDVNGNLATRIAPKAGQTGSMQTTTSYSYDVLNRLSSKSYSNPFNTTVRFGYDGIALTGCSGPAPPTINSSTNLVGRRTAMCSGNSASSWSYDPVGRHLIEKRTNKGSSSAISTVGYSYDKDGSLSALTYPSGDVVTYTVGGAGRPTQAADTVRGYATGATYAPHGALASMTNGSGIVTSNAYDDRLQPVLLSAGVAGQNPIFSLCYDFHLGVAVSNGPCSLNAHTTGDNGNVFQVINNVDSTRSAAFAYDPLNRITQASTVNTTSANCWSQVYSLDVWGNLTNMSGVPSMPKCNTMTLAAAPASTQNELNGYCYDAAGNLALNSPCPTGTLTPAYAYDAENRLTGTAGYAYSYDADGMRIEKNSGSSGTMYWPGPSGEILTETDLNGVVNEEYVYFNGERIARIDRPSGMVHYYFSNHLGSASVITDAAGNIQQQSDYYPFGGVAYASGGDTNRYKFTGKERDTESGLDMFGARYYGSSLARFMTPDWAAKPTNVPYASFGNPQSLNLYSYVNNNPTTTRDPDGHCGEDACVIEGSAALLYIGGAALVAGTAAVLNTPAGQRSVSTFTSAASQSISDTVHAIGNFFHPDNSGKATSPPGTTTTNVATGTPASTSQQGAVDTSPKSLIVVSPGGDAIPVPNGASGPVPVVNNAGNTTGFGYTGGSGGNGLSDNTTGVRVMDPTPARGASPGYPNGYVSYGNSSGQTVNGQTGQTVPRRDPSAHVPLKPCPRGGSC
jgi:RHS repeat-associated protein